MFRLICLTHTIMIIATRCRARMLLRFLYNYKKGFFRDGYSNLILPRESISIEHVVPRCHLPANKIWDLNNLLLVDKYTNSQRLNARFGRESVHGLSFCPANDLCKGQVSRICAHMIDTYALNQDEIIPKDLMLEWHIDYPVSDH